MVLDGMSSLISLTFRSPSPLGKVVDMIPSISSKASLPGSAGYRESLFDGLRDSAKQPARSTELQAVLGKQYQITIRIVVMWMPSHCGRFWWHRRCGTDYVESRDVVRCRM